MTSLEHKQVKKSRQKDSPVACPLAGTGREATHNSRWNMRYRASITHSISRGAYGHCFAFYSVHIPCRLLQNRRTDCSTGGRFNQCCFLARWRGGSLQKLAAELMGGNHQAAKRRRRTWADPVCHRASPSLCNHVRSWLQDIPFAFASHSPRLWRAIIQIVHRTSNIVHRQTPSASGRLRRKWAMKRRNSAWLVGLGVS